MDAELEPGLEEDMSGQDTLTRLKRLENELARAKKRTELHEFVSGAGDSAISSTLGTNRIMCPLRLPGAINAKRISILVGPSAGSMSISVALYKLENFDELGAGTISTSAASRQDMRFRRVTRSLGSLTTSSLGVNLLADFPTEKRLDPEIATFAVAINVIGADAGVLQSTSDHMVGRCYPSAAPPTSVTDFPEDVIVNNSTIYFFPVIGVRSTVGVRLNGGV